MTQDTIVALSVLGVVGQVLIVLALIVGVLALVGVRGPLAAIRNLLWGYELWGAFVVAAIATGGSLFYSQVAHFIPCEFCWFQRVLMYPLSILTLLIAARGDNRAARYLLPLPIVGAGTSIYHMLIERGVIEEPKACTVVRARRLRHQLDRGPRVRLSHDPDPGSHRLPSYHRILTPRLHRRSRGTGYPSRPCRAVRERDNRGKRPRRQHRRPSVRRASAGLALARRRPARLRSEAASS